MSRLELTTFGVPHIKIDGRSIAALSARKAQALLIYLAVTNQQHSRQVLAGLLWGEMPEDKARRNLRVTLSRIRTPLEAHLHIRRRSLRLNEAATFSVDVAEFESCLAPPTPSLAQLERAAALYRGHFLQDFELRDAPLFEDWIRPLQERYRQMAMETMYRLATHFTTQKQYATAIDYANRLLQLEPWLEEAHRQLMLLLALSGKRSAALNQYESCRSLLQEELGIEPAAATVALYQQILNEEIQPAAQPIAVPQPALASPAPNQVPAGINHFVGRATDTEALAKLLGAEDGPPLLALVGMGGVGKSSLAVQLAKTIQSAFPDGILWANTASSEPMSILESWATAYDYDFSRIGDLESMAAAFRGVLADKHTLIVLDDVTSASRIRPLLPNGAHCRVLLTTRNQDLARALNAQVWQLRELALENGRLLLSNVLGQNRVAAEPEAAAEICTLLQNLPLALEITAQRLKSRPRRRLADMAEQLRDETSRLSQLQISDRAVRASFAVSWEALDAERKRIFALIGLFNGRSFTAEAMAHIANMAKYPLEDRLFDLVNLSLLREEAERRYQQHPLLADFAREKLGEDVREDEYGRFTHYYLQFVQQNQTDYDALRPEWDNLMAAMEAAHTHQLHQTVIEFADALNDAWFARGRYSQACQGYEWVNKSVLKLNDKNRHSQNLLDWARACIEQSNFDEARARLENCLKIFQDEDDLIHLANAQFLLSRVAMNQSNYEEATKLVNHALKIRAQLNDQIGTADLIKVQARILYGQRLYQDAYQLGHEALSIYEKYNHQLGRLQTLNLLVNCQVELKRSGKTDLEKALQNGQNALALAESLQNSGEKVVALYGLSRIHLIIGEMKLAEEEAKQSLEASRQIGDRRTEAMVTMHLSEIFYYQEEYHEALQVAYSINPLLKILEAKGNEAVNWWNIGHFHQKLQELDHARKAWSNSYQLANEIQNTGLLERLRPYLQP